MNITKDEARILAVALDHYSPQEKAGSKEEADQIANAMDRLQDKLLNFFVEAELSLMVSQQPPCGAWRLLAIVWSVILIQLYESQNH